MSITDAMAVKNSNRFVIPCAGKMFKSAIPGNDRALCFVFNKGYFEAETLESMNTILRDASEMEGFVFVGGIERVRLKRQKIITYRQRLFFKNLHVLLSFCKIYGIKLEVDRDFEIDIDNVLNCTEDLVYLERYARRFNETIDDWLTHCSLIELYYYAKTLGVKTNLEGRINVFLHGRKDYLSRSPFLISSYSLDEGTSGVFLGYSINDKRLYHRAVSHEDLVGIGYTDKNVEKDIKEGKI